MKSKQIEGKGGWVYLLPRAKYGLLKSRVKYKESKSYGKLVACTAAVRKLEANKNNELYVHARGGGGGE